MIYAILGAIVLMIAFLVLMTSLLSAAPQETLEEQAACIRKDAEERKAKQQRKAEKRARRRDKWQR